MISTRWRGLVLAASTCALFCPAAWPDITVDGAYGAAGTATVSFAPATNIRVRDLALDADGKAVLTGYAAVTPVGVATHEVMLLRLNTDGTPDTTFSGDGRVLLASPSCPPPSGVGGVEGAGVVVQPSGHILVAATCHGAPNSRVVMFRFLADGTPDLSFGMNGVIEHPGPAGSNGTRAMDVVLQSDGRIVVAGEINVNSFPGAGLVLRLNVDGTLDTTFAANGYFRPDLPGTSSWYASVARMSDDRIVVGGHIAATGVATSNFNFFVTRLSANGALDATFAGGGHRNLDLPVLSRPPTIVTASQDFVTGVTLRADGTVVAAGNVSANGSANRQAILVQLTPAGNLDTAFGDGGFRLLTSGGGDDMAFHSFVRAGGDLVVIGAMRPVQVSADGSLVRAYLTNSRMDAGAMQADGNIVASLSVAFNGESTVGATRLQVSALPAPDTTPDAFMFTSAHNVRLATVQVSDPVFITGIDSRASVTVEGGEFSPGCSGTWLTAGQMTFIENGGTVCVRHTSAATSTTLTDTRLTVGGMSSAFTSMTGDADPDGFTFTNQTGVAVATVTVSSAITITGITIDAPVSVAGGEYSVGCGAANYTSAAGAVAAGQSICVRHTSSANTSATTSTTLTVGTTSSAFTSTTVAAAGAVAVGGGSEGGGGGGGSFDWLLLALLSIALISKWGATRGRSAVHAGTSRPRAARVHRLVDGSSGSPSFL